MEKQKFHEKHISTTILIVFFCCTFYCLLQWGVSEISEVYCMQQKIRSLNWSLFFVHYWGNTIFTILHLGGHLEKGDCTKLFTTLASNKDHTIQILHKQSSQLQVIQYEPFQDLKLNFSHCVKTLVAPWYINRPKIIATKWPYIYSF